MDTSCAVHVPSMYGSCTVHVPLMYPVFIVVYRLRAVFDYIGQNGPRAGLYATVQCMTPRGRVLRYNVALLPGSPQLSVISRLRHWE